MEECRVWMDAFEELKSKFSEKTIKNTFDTTNIKDLNKKGDAYYIDLFFRNRFQQDKNTDDKQDQDFGNSWKAFVSKYSNCPQKWMSDFEIRREKFEIHSYIGAMMAFHRFSMEKFDMCFVPAHYGCVSCTEHTPRKMWDADKGIEQLPVELIDLFKIMEDQRMKPKGFNVAKRSSQFENVQGAPKKIKNKMSKDIGGCDKLDAKTSVGQLDKIDKIDKLSKETQESFAAVRNMVLRVDNKLDHIIKPTTLTKLPNIASLTRGIESDKLKEFKKDIINELKDYINGELKKLKEDIVEETKQEIESAFKKDFDQVNIHIQSLKNKTNKNKHDILQHQQTFINLDQQVAREGELKVLQENQFNLWNMAGDHERSITALMPPKK